MTRRHRRARDTAPPVEQFMDHALALAAARLGQVAPNPAVGCVILSAGGNVIAEAANSLVLSKKNIDQIIVFALMLAGFQRRHRVDAFIHLRVDRGPIRRMRGGRVGPGGVGIGDDRRLLAQRIGDHGRSAVADNAFALALLSTIQITPIPASIAESSAPSNPRMAVMTMGLVGESIRSQAASTGERRRPETRGRRGIRPGVREGEAKGNGGRAPPRKLAAGPAP